MREVWISVHSEGGIEFAVSAVHAGSYPEHLHTTVEFLLQLHAPGVALIRGHPILLQPGDLLAILPNEVHARDPSLLIQFAALEIEPGELRRLSGADFPDTLAPDDPVRLWRGALAPGEVCDLERAIRDDLTGVTAHAQRRILERALGHPLLRRGIRPRRPAGLPQDVLRQARAALDSADGLDQLRSISGFNEHYFISAFRQSFGLPPHQVLLGRKLDRTRVAVIATSSRLVDIAAAQGFYDQSHLCRLFKRAYAVSPAIYRQNVHLYPTALPPFP